MALTRSIPIHFDYPRHHFYSDPFDSQRDSMRDFFRDQLRDPLREPARDLFREPMRDYHVRDPFRDTRSLYTDAAYQAALQPVQPTLPISRSFFNPERQLGSMDGEMARMATEMKQMYNNVQHLMPVDANPESWRIKENFHLDNPVVHDHTGSRLFRLQFDVRQFRPEEIHVTTAGNQLTVHAKHDEKHDGKSLHREYHRQYNLPKDMTADLLSSKLTRDGILSIEAPIAGKTGERDHMIPIKHN